MSDAVECKTCGKPFQPFRTLNGNLQVEQCSPCGEADLKKAFAKLEAAEERYERQFGEGSLARMSGAVFGGRNGNN